jgi:hypothetical protein
LQLGKPPGTIGLLVGMAVIAGAMEIFGCVRRRELYRVPRQLALWTILPLALAAALRHHRGQISVMQLVRDGPAHRQNYDLDVEVPLQIDRVTLQRLGHRSLPGTPYRNYTPQMHQNLFVVIRLGYPCERAT